MNQIGIRLEHIKCRKNERNERTLDRTSEK